MERRTFIRTAALGSLALSLLPSASVFAGTEASTPLLLPPVSSHIRHGLLTPVGVLPKGWPSWIQRFQREVFYKNGLTPSADDLQCCLIELEGTPLTISYNQQQACVSVGDETVSLSEGMQQATVGNYRATVLRTNADAQAHTITSQQHFVAMLAGTAEVNRQTVFTGQAVQAKGNDLHICLAANTLALHIDEIHKQ